MDTTNKCRALLHHASEHLAQGSRPLGMALYLEAEKCLPDVPDPVQFLALTLQAEVLVRRYMLPEPGDDQS